MKNNKLYSCEDLQGSIYFGPNALRHCCQRFFVNGKMEGDVEILKVKSDADINVQKIISAKKKIVDDLNNNKKTPCDGCPKLQFKEWTDIEEIKINKISLEAHSKCNARCSYCSDMFYGGLNPNYDLNEMLIKFRKLNFFDENVAVTWGGGEPVLLKNFRNIFKKFIDSKYPKFQDVRVYSNSIIYSDLIHQYLDQNKIILTTSTDAGTQETYQKVRGVKKGFLQIFKNLKRYNTKKNGNIIIKYILTTDNYKNQEIDSFVNLIKEHKLLNCDFEISTDYKFENLDLEKSLSIVYFYNTLSKAGAKFIHFDDHVRKRLFKFFKESFSIKQMEKNKMFDNLREYFDKDIIVWGTGRYADEIIKNSFLFKKSKVAYYVDGMTKKHNSFISEKVYTPDKILTSDNPILIASSTYWQEIYRKILDLGVDKKRVINTLII